MSFSCAIMLYLLLITPANEQAAIPSALRDPHSLACFLVTSREELLGQQQQQQRPSVALRTHAGPDSRPRRGGKCLGASHLAAGEKDRLQAVEPLPCSATPQYKRGKGRGAGEVCESLTGGQREWESPETRRSAAGPWGNQGALACKTELAKLGEVGGRAQGSLLPAWDGTLSRLPPPPLLLPPAAPIARVALALPRPLLLSFSLFLGGVSCLLSNLQRDAAAAAAIARRRQGPESARAAAAAAPPAGVSQAGASRLVLVRRPGTRPVIPACLSVSRSLARSLSAPPPRSGGRRRGCRPEGPRASAGYALHCGASLARRATAVFVGSLMQP